MPHGFSGRLIPSLSPPREGLVKGLAIESRWKIDAD